MRLKDAVKIVERNVSGKDADTVEFSVAVRCLLDAAKRLLKARAALKQVAVLVSDEEHLNQQEFGFGEED